MTSLAETVFLLAVDEHGKPLAPRPAGEVVAAGLYLEELLRGAEAPRAEVAWQVAIARRTGDALEQVRRLSPHSVATLVERRVLGLFVRRRFVPVDPSAARLADQRLRQALRPGAHCDTETAALAVLCATSGIARRRVPPPRSRTQRQVLAEHVTALVESLPPDLLPLLRAARARRAALAASSDGWAPHTDSDPYGDAGGGSGGDGGDGGGGD